VSADILSVRPRWRHPPTKYTLAACVPSPCSSSVYAGSGVGRIQQAIPSTSKQHTNTDKAAAQQAVAHGRSPLCRLCASPAAAAAAPRHSAHSVTQRHRLCCRKLRAQPPLRQQQPPASILLRSGCGRGSPHATISRWETPQANQQLAWHTGPPSMWDAPPPRQWRQWRGLRCWRHGA
jgi:hypothetical protein